MMTRSPPFVPLLILIAAAVLSSSLIGITTAVPEIDREFLSEFEETYLFYFSSPTDVEFSSDGRLLLITDKGGQLWVIENDENTQNDDIKPKRAIDLASRMCTNGERGLGGVALHPQYPTKPYVYLHYNYNKYDDCYNGDNRQGLGRGPVNRLSRFILDPNTKRVDTSSEKVFLETPRQPVHNHNGGDIAFDKNGLLYATLGDGGTRVWKNDDDVYYSQALDKLFGKIVRLTEDGDIPDDNPFTRSQGHPNSVRCGETEGEAPDAFTKCQEIYATGLRNPFRLAFDPDSSDAARFYINDVGRSTWEKIVEGKSGGNYGYPTQDGPCDVSSKSHRSCEPNEYTQNAIHWYLHDEEDGGCITGGAFVSEKYGWPDSLFRDTYLYSEYALGGIHVIIKGNKGCSYPTCDPPISDYDTRVLSKNEKIVSMQFGLFKDGLYALYYVTRGRNGDKRNTAGLYRIAFTGAANRSPLAMIDADVTYGFSPLLVHFDGEASPDPDGDALSYLWDFDGDGEVDSSQPNSSYEYTVAGTYSASLTVDDGKGGTSTASIRIEVDNTPPIPVIESPAEGTIFAVGDKYVLLGSAVDVEDGELPKESLVWEVRQHHNNHWHPFLDPTEGERIELDGAPEPEDFDASLTSYLEIILTATDSTGLSATARRVLMPKMVKVTFGTIPIGLRLVAYGDIIYTPATVITWENHEFEVEAHAVTYECGEPFSFISWSDGGDRIHNFVATSSSSSSEEPHKLVATFKSERPYIVGSAGHSTPEEQLSMKQGTETSNLEDIAETSILEDAAESYNLEDTASGTSSTGAKGGSSAISAAAIAIMSLGIVLGVAGLW